MLKVRYLGHSAFELEHGGKSVLIDPFLKGNPVAERAGIRPDSLRPSAILLSHGHGDHVGDALTIAKASGATIVAPYELAMYCQRKGATAHPMHIGGSRRFDFGWVKLTPAWHGSAVEEDGRVIYTGNPCGFLVEMGGKTAYHTGDTGLFGDMALIGQRHRIDVALLPIGDNFTMGPEDALYAATLIKPRLVIPMHYDTFDLIRQDAAAFARRVEEAGIRCQVVGAGQSLEIP